MEITRLTDYIINKIYKVNDSTLLVNVDGWEIWKKVKGSWQIKEEVMRKDYQEYIKASLMLREKELVEFELYEGPRVFLLTKEEIQGQEKKLRSQEEKKAEVRRLEADRLHQEQQERDELSSLVYEVRRELEGLKVKDIAPEELRQYRAYMQNILENLKNGEIKDTKTTRKVRKDSRLELYEDEIDNYMKSGKYRSINQLCKDLKINRTTFYNLKLNEYIK